MSAIDPKQTSAPAARWRNCLRGNFTVMLHEFEHPPRTIQNIQKRCKCLLLAQSGRHNCADECSAFRGKADIVHIGASNKKIGAKGQASALGGRPHQSRRHRDTPTISASKLLSHCSRQRRTDRGKIAGWLLRKNHGRTNRPLRVNFEKILRCTEVPCAVDGRHSDI